ncbi:hypothetical protein [Streptomyces griseorubiginosus]|uniref:hypothetical protein n=1 Tax=Streptomyces griseorubiginosus TaxID=67304 RepID=UPI0036ED315A
MGELKMKQWPQAHSAVPARWQAMFEGMPGRTEGRLGRAEPRLGIRQLMIGLLANLPRENPDLGATPCDAATASVRRHFRDGHAETW